MESRPDRENDGIDSLWFSSSATVHDGDKYDPFVVAPVSNLSGGSSRQTGAADQRLDGSWELCVG